MQVAMGKFGLFLAWAGMIGSMGCSLSSGSSGQPVAVDAAEVCSISSSRIHGGQAMQAAEPLAKSIVGILRFGGDDGGMLCTGVIISQDTILTAAHCALGKAQQFRIVFNTSLVRPNCPSSELVREVETVFVHEEYNPKEEFWKSNDLAMLKLKSKIPLGFVPMKLMTDFSNVNNSNVVVAGFGVSATNQKDYGILKRTRISRMTEVESQDRVQRLTWDAPALVFDQSHGTGICQGDSGGGAFMQVADSKGQEDYRLIGIASVVISAEEKEPCSQLSAHMNTRFYRSWIRDGMKKLHLSKEAKSEPNEVDTKSK